jgi:hypothetical protein
VKVNAEDEMPLQLSVHTVDDIPAKAFVKKLAEGEAYHNLMHFLGFKMCLCFYFIFHANNTFT